MFWALFVAQDASCATSGAASFPWGMSIGVHTIFLQISSLTYYTHNSFQDQAERV
jgi:hypothetical protein